MRHERMLLTNFTRVNSMNLSNVVLAAAVSGILMGCGGSTPPAEAPSAEVPATPPADAPAADAPAAAAGDAAAAGAKHDCKGKNDCKGQGGCHTDKHDCKGKNDCKGQGGCKA